MINPPFVLEGIDGRYMTAESARSVAFVFLLGLACESSIASKTHATILCVSVDG